MNASQQQRILQVVAEASQALAGAAAALTNGGSPMVPGLYAGFLPDNVKGAPLDYFVYGMDFLTIAAAGGAATAAFTVQSDSDFLIAQLAGIEVDPAAEQTPLPVSALTIQITDSGSGRNLQDRSVAYSSVVGTGQLPAVLPYPKFIDRASQVSATIVNNDSAAQAYRVRLSFIGFKVFDMMRR